MALLDPLRALERTGLAQWVQADAYAFPALEAAHVVSVMLVFGSIAMLDLRLLGVISRKRAVTEAAGEVLPWTWAGFVIATATGALLFTAQASAYFDNRELRIKMILMALAGLNLAAFHRLTWRTVRAWNDAPRTPVGARIAALLSLALWTGVVVAGRWIGWTLTPSG
jgi:hypothetical protein